MKYYDLWLTNDIKFDASINASCNYCCDIRISLHKLCDFSLEMYGNFFVALL